MAKESDFVKRAQEIIAAILEPPLVVLQGEALLYQVTVNNLLEVTVVPGKPKRGDSAFQTDLCIFEKKGKDLRIPRVVLEFKMAITTHDVLTYSAKARKHKQVYPYLRYGVVASTEDSVPGRVFTHNEALDFFAGVKKLDGNGLSQFFKKLIDAEVASSRLLESLTFGKARTRLFRNEVILEKDG